MSTNQYCLTKVSFPDFIHEIGALRIRAWRSEPGIDPVFFARNTWIETQDQLAHHWIIRDKNQIVAAARLSIHEALETVPYAALLPAEYDKRYEGKRIASINRLVVDPDYRGRGFARMLDQARLDLAINENIDILLAQPQLSRLTTLSKLGFSYVCELPSTPEMPERPLFFMELRLTD
ncbi:GNAT family N-acetyltransferase [Spirosoma sp. SC4-14]|uniref:GNAT family N-acetyltransferase n=1 Tax=Spirosoma sp. SC4-14 TaxID=3128900 RepID=UPI0030D1E33F